MFLSVSLCMHHSTISLYLSIYLSYTHTLSLSLSLVLLQTFNQQSCIIFKDKATIVIDMGAPDPQMINSMQVARLTEKYDPSKADPFGWPKDAPPATLVQAWAAAAKVSPFAACRDFRTTVTATGARIGAVTPGQKPKKGEDELTQMNFSVPVVSADGNEGLVLEVGKAGQGSEVAVLVHLRKDKDGAWSEVDALVPSIS